MNSNCVRPTLYIGLGGTGGDVLLKLRRKFLMHSWGQQGEKVKLSSLSEFPLAQFINFDLDKGPVIDSGRAQSEDLLFNSIKFTEEEKIVESFSLDTYSCNEDALDRYPNIKEWFPLKPQKIHELAIDTMKGADQIRAISRLYFFDKYTKVRDKIRFKLKTLKAGVSYETQLSQLGLKTEANRCRIVVVCSAAGATGSGSFLDMGWLAHWLAYSENYDADVELMLVMPTAYSGRNKDLIEANAYAALMELEAAMCGNKSYVPRWDNYDRPVLNSTPYSEVYIVDSGNLAHQFTKNISDVCHMLADTLFEDFAAGDFVNRKRSVAVNQAQHKNFLFNALVPQNRFGNMCLPYSQRYSALGQSVLDTQQEARRDEKAHLWAGEMLKAFFGVGSGSLEVNRATDKQCDNFLADYVGLKTIPFTELPQFSEKSIELKLSMGEFLDFSLVDELLTDKNSSLTAGVEKRVNDRIDSIRTGFDLKEWATQVREAVKGMELDAVRDQEPSADSIEGRISKRRSELLDTRKKAIEDQLYAYLDNKELGGFIFILSLAEQMKDKIEAQNNGLIANLQMNAGRYKEIKEAIRSREFERLVNNLEETSKGFSFFANNEKQSLAIVESLKIEIAGLVKIQLRAKATEQAVIFLNELSRWLGEKIGVDFNEVAKWSGLLGAFQAGRDAVIDMLNSLYQSVNILQSELKKEHATLISIDMPDHQIPTPSTKQMRDWADDVLFDFGGSKQFFEMLADSEKKGQILSKVVKMAECQLLAVAQVGDDTVVADPLIQALEQMSAANRAELFKKWIARAMPWVDANLTGNFVLKADQYKCIISVSNDAEFKRKFSEELNACVPTQAGITSAQLDIVKMDVPGKAVCYTELSGFPLTVLRGIESWRTSYHKELEISPLHTQIDVTQFNHPIAPGPAELNSLAEDFKTFLLAVMTGVLSRAKQKRIPAGQYEFELSKGNCRRVGNERSIRQNGLVLQFREAIISQVEELLNNADGYVLVALSALASYYATQVYAPRLVIDETGLTVLKKGFASTMAKELSDELRDKAVIKELSSVQIEEIAEKLLDANSLKEWAIAIPGSDEDAYVWEVRDELGEGGDPHLKYALSPQMLEAGGASHFIKKNYQKEKEFLPSVNFPPLPPPHKAVKKRRLPPPIPTRIDLDEDLDEDFTGTPPNLPPPLPLNVPSIDRLAILESIKNAAVLKDEGILSQVEFDTLKAELLKKLIS